MEHKEIPIIYKQIIPIEVKISNYLIGDPAYPLTSFCMKEHESCKSNAQTVFNSMLREARNHIECSEIFKILKKISQTKYILEVPQKESMARIY